MFRNCNNYDSIGRRISQISEDEAVYDEVSEKSELPSFLNDANEDVIKKFLKVWNDQDIPSESLRQEMIHLLAVSLLTTKQLTAYNHYMGERRHCQQELLLEIRRMSVAAQKALSILLYAEIEEQYKLAKNFPSSIRRELRNFARRRLAKNT
ncbi:unnamed protein product [Thelazia callipaeda]|uniref:Uncharacterized protein n=1 Tax=Thelazia callipaeda TaxID=103827 RepID=A0A0N5CVT1_THECL|nr:unnamed protein product [Thelazia callipaeda]